MIQYRQNNGFLGSIQDNNSCRIEVNGNTFSIIRRIYGYDEYDWYDERIENIIDLRID